MTNKLLDALHALGKAYDTKAPLNDPVLAVLKVYGALQYTGFEQINSPDENGKTLIQRMRIAANEPIGDPRGPNDILMDEAADALEKAAEELRIVEREIDVPSEALKLIGATQRRTE